MVDEVSVKIGGMSCAMCAKAVEIALKSLEGVKYDKFSHWKGENSF